VPKDNTLLSECQIFRTIFLSIGHFCTKECTIGNLARRESARLVSQSKCAIMDPDHRVPLKGGKSVEESTDVGSRLRELREQRDLSLRALAEMCQVSANTVSLIERGLSSPCVDTLQRLAKGLGVPIASFFETGELSARLVLSRSADRMHRSCPGMTIEHLGSGLADHAFASFLITMEPATSAQTATIEHPGAEWAYCLEGLVEYEVDGQEYRLAAGDNLLFDASLPHRWRNRGPTLARMLLIFDAGQRNDLTVEQHLAT